MVNNRILLAIDATQASERAARYVGEVLGQADAHVRLLHVLPTAPLARTEVPRSRVPAREQAGRRADPFVRIPAMERAKQAHPLLERMRAILLEEGLGEDQLELDFHAPAPEESVPRVLLEQARQHDCDTIVVGYRKLPWHRELFYKHVGSWLVRHAREHAVWVIE